MSFSSGFRSGASVADGWIKNAEKREEEEAQNKLFTIAREMETARQKQNAEGAKLGKLFDGMSSNDIGGMIMKQAMSQGIKMTDDMARLSYGVGDALFGGIKEYRAYERKNKLFDLKEQKTKQFIENNNRLTTLRNRSGGGTESAADAVSMDIYGVPYLELKSSGRKTVNQIMYSKPDKVKDKTTSNITDYEYAKDNPPFAKTHMIDTGDIIEEEEETKTKKKTWRDYLKAGN